jgi:histidine ammonia-lyase
MTSTITLANLYTDLDHSLSELRRDPARVRKSRQIVDDVVRTGKTIYGINTGFGILARERIPPDKLTLLQKNLLLSHAVGVGPPVPREITALMLRLKIHALGIGNSGVSLPTFERLLRCAELDLVPVVPARLRCVPQVHGASRDALTYASSAMETEINSVTDNPLVFDNGDVVSGGNFHGQPIALPLDVAAIALAEFGSISERRTYLLLEGVDGLPPLLMQDTGVNSGFMIPQYTAAALVSENKVLSHPASVDSIPTCLGQEDHVSMGSIAAVKLLSVYENLEHILAIELLCAAQALDFRAPLKPGRGVRRAHELIRSHIPHRVRDATFQEHLNQMQELMRNGDLLACEAKNGIILS